MAVKVDTEEQINKLKRILEKTAEENYFNFQHPAVLAISQELDQLIIEVMKTPYSKNLFN